MKKGDELEKAALKALKPKSDWINLVFIGAAVIIGILVIFFLVAPFFSGLVVQDDETPEPDTPEPVEDAPIGNVPSNTSNNTISINDSSSSSGSNYSSDYSGGSSGGGDGGDSGDDCSNDAGCSSSGIFCEGNFSYACTLESDGCYDKSNLTECESGYNCVNSSGCVAVEECTSNLNCTHLNSVCGYGVCNASSSCELTFNLSSTICRADAGECDVAEYCTGNASTCPSNGFEPEGTSCSSGECDSAGSCVSNSSIEVDSCMNLSQENSVYVLNSSIVNNNLSISCINIIEENITLDCQDYFIQSGNDVTGVYSNSSLTTIKDCNISVGKNAGGYGIQLEQANDSHIFNNTLSNQYTGLFLSESSHGTIEENVLDSNQHKGLHLLLSYQNYIGNNEINNGAFYGIVSAKSATNMIYENNINSNFWYGILIDVSLSEEPDGENIISDNYISSSRENLQVFTSDNVILNNIIDNSTLYNGIYVYDCLNNTIINNTVTNSEISGLGLESSHNNLVINNTLNSNEEYGIEVYDSNNNIIENNTASLNLINGLYVEVSSDNNVSRNSLCNNTVDVYCDSSQTFLDNDCDSGSVCGGSCSMCSLSGFSGTGAAVSVEVKNKITLALILLTIMAIVAITYLKPRKKK